jgi:putative membrane protein insertion efficiency factor
LIARPLIWLFVGLIRLYRLTLSPFVGRSCRFRPSCSRYAEEALFVHGLFRGAALAARRLFRCHPWGGSGYDPVPPGTDGGRPPIQLPNS